MASDENLMLTEDHELNFLLETWGKKRSKKNRDLLRAKIKDYKADKDFAPHNRKNFDKYVDEKKIVDLFEGAMEKTQETGKSTPAAKSKRKSIDLNQFLAEIERRAYEIYEDRWRSHISGDDFTDWLQAEKEIKEKYGMD